MPCSYDKQPMTDSKEGENSFVQTHHTSTSKENMEVENSAMLEVTNLLNWELVVDPKTLPDNDSHNNGNRDVNHVINKAHAISPGISESKNIPDDELEESADKAKSQPFTVTNYVASDEDMKKIAAACYEYVMAEIENCSDTSQLSEVDDQQCEEDKVLYQLDVEPLTESTDEASGLPEVDTQNMYHNENMQCIAMACYEVVMDMLRNSDNLSEDDAALEHNMDDLEVVELSIDNSFELPSSPPSVCSSDVHQHFHHDKANTEVPPDNSKNAPSCTTENTGSHCCVKASSADSLVLCNEQTDTDHPIEPSMKNTEKATTTLKVVGCNKISEGMSSDSLCKFSMFVYYCNESLSM